MKKQLMIIGSVILLLLSGCNKVNRTAELDLGRKVNDAETQNIQTDLEMYLTLYSAMNDTMMDISEDDSLNKEEKQEQINLVFVKYMDDMDTFLAVRVSDDLRYLATSSELYLTYIALLQTYCETYQEEKEMLFQELDLADPEFDENRSVQALSMVESFYLGLISDSQ